jgi:hypothetical protein
MDVMEQWARHYLFQLVVEEESRQDINAGVK